MKKRTIHAALVGCGDIAGAYIDAAAKARRCRIVQVMDVNAALAQSRGRALGVPATAAFEEVLANDDVDAVILCVPHHLHAPLTIQALEGGKHVMCDKPIATTVADGKKMIRAARRAGRRLTVNYMMRCTDKARYARRLIREGILGEIFAMTIVAASRKPDIYWTQGWNRVTATDWRKRRRQAGGGVALMNVSHYVDLLFGITGLSAWGVVGMKGTFNSPPDVDVEDFAAGAFRLRNGGILSVLASSCYAGGLSPHVSLLGRKGQMELETGKADTIRVYLADAGRRRIKANEWVDLPVPRGAGPDGYPRLLDEFAAAVCDGAPVPVDPRDALHTLACILALYGENAELPRAYGA